MVKSAIVAKLAGLEATILLNKDSSATSHKEIANRATSTRDLDVHSQIINCTSSYLNVGYSPFLSEDEFIA